MNKEDLLYRFIKRVQREKKLTLLIKNIFDYDDINDYNYIFRITKESGVVIIDIYDNITKNRFNRYIFNYLLEKPNITINKEMVYVSYIYPLTFSKDNNKLYKLGYLMTLDSGKILAYAETFLDNELVNILAKIIKK